MPIISVIMPVYNAEKYIRSAIESILNQTFQDFEFIIINDGSTDRSPKIIQLYNDSRIRLINQKNRGIVHSLNEGIKISCGKYIARMDADDVSLPQRLEKQFLFLEKNTDIGILGTTFLIINDKDKIIGANSVLTDDDDLKLEILFNTTFGHGTVMLRKEILKQNYCYSYQKEAKYIEDYDFWIRLAENTKLANLSDILYLWRDNQEGISRTNYLIQMRNTYKLRNRQLKNLKRLNNPNIISFKKILKYKSEVYQYNRKKIIIKRQDHLSMIYFLLSYYAIWNFHFLLSLKALIISISCCPIIFFKIIWKRFSIKYKT